MKDILTDLLCNKIKYLSDTPLTEAKAAAILNSVKTTIENNPTLQAAGVTLPTITPDMVTKLIGGQCTAIVSQLSPTTDAILKIKDVNETVTNNIIGDVLEQIDYNETKPVSIENYASRTFSCNNNGTKATLTFDNGIVATVNDLETPPLWTIDGKIYYLYWKPDNSDILGFYEKEGADLIPIKTKITLATVPTFNGYVITGKEINSPDCKKKAGDFDPTIIGDYFTEAGLNRLKDKLAKQGASNTEITVKDCTDATKTPKTVDATSITATAGQKGINIELCWDGTKWKISHSFKTGALIIPSGYTGSVAEVESASNAVADRVKETGLKASTSHHEAGKDGVTMAMFVVGAVKNIGANASKISELEEVVTKLDDIAEGYSS